MNKLTKVSIAAVFAAMLTVAVSAQNWDNGPVVVYDEANGRGNATSFDVGEFRNNRGEFRTLRNDAAASVEVPNGYSVRFCEKEGNGSGGGKCEVFGEGYHNLRNANIASYIRVDGPQNGWGNNGGWGNNNGNNNNYQRGVTVYSDSNSGGSSQIYGIGRYLSGAGQFGNLKNDQASSVTVEKGFRVKLCENEGTDGFGSGQCEEYGEGSFNLKYNDKASYIEVRRAGRGNGGWGNNNGNNGGWGNNNGNNGGWGNNGNNGGWGNAPVIVFSDRNQTGNRQVYNVGTYRNDYGQLGGIANDDASSVYVAQGFRVRLCESEKNGNGGGKCEEFGPGSYNLKYDNKASFISVWSSY